ncbi:hypothetical protein BKA65DRAFT_557168 [Rhexocercosporidium sp. MPI-PUGE-AT-0058]|nr:hypothetical protein BKA65DRAFT_557168 [Rhexocercosporidium sp. MPI-PUGE-AT-0058]
MDAALVIGCGEGGLGIFGFAIARSLSSLTYLQDMPNVMLIVPDAKSPGSIGAVLVL